MAKQQTEDELNLRRKARRRLIGAIALTLAVVVILPMVLDSEPKSTGNNIDLSIPDPDKAGAFVPGVAIPEAKPLPAVPAAETGSAQAAREPDADKPVVAEIQSRKVEPGKVQPALQKPAETPNSDKQVSAEGFVAQVGAYANADTARHEFKKLKQWGFKVYTEKVGGNIRVRVGPYADHDKAEKVAKLLEKHGYHPVIVSSK
jgi:DedD protein